MTQNQNYSKSNRYKTKHVVAIVMAIRDEETFIECNIEYHLDRGFDYIFIVNHCSQDKTDVILDKYKDNPRVVVLEENSPTYDQTKMIEYLVSYANESYRIDWFLFIDADEFFSVKDGEDIHSLILKLEAKNIPYATIGWVNALFDFSLTDYSCAAVGAIDTGKFYYPWPEKEWQEYGHFRKTLVKNHKNIGYVRGGHYVRTENNRDFFGDFHWNPFIVPYSEARIYHYEFRNSAENLLKKWKNFKNYHSDYVAEGKPKHDRISQIVKYYEYYKDKVDEMNEFWFHEHRTLWGTLIPQKRLLFDTTMVGWYGSFVRKKIESGQVKSVCLMRQGHLGDVIMTEPVARYLKKYIKRIYLLTDLVHVKDVLPTFDGVHPYTRESFISLNCDISIKLIYENSTNNKSYIQGYFESIGYPEIQERYIPSVKNNWPKGMLEDYVLIAPNTSQWEEQKRSWGVDKFYTLSELIKKNLGLKVVILDKQHSFSKMMSLIRNCKFFIGNDSGPAVIAQSLDKKSFVIFGATSPKYLHLSENAIPIYDNKRHALCNHKTRQEEIGCCEDFCMERISVNHVYEEIIKNI